MKLSHFFAFLFLSGIQCSGQVANYVNNGSFEEIDNCVLLSPQNKVQFWTGLDTTKVNYLTFNYCAGNVPGLNTQLDYQFPRTGYGYIEGTVFCANCGDNVPYWRFRNKLKKNLIANLPYCVKFYCNIRNHSTVGIDAIGAYFGDNSIDTIKYSTIPISYLQPQIANPSGNIISDTLNWTLITGTFVATGNEKNLVIGCFKDFGSVNYQQLGNWYPGLFCDILIDDVSCIEMDVAAYAGPDKRFFVGDSVYLGRELDFAVDPYCFWYQLPNMSTAIDTASGIWVKPTTTSTYVVRQELECNTVKWDTVVVYKDAVGLEKLKIINEALKISPNPATDRINVSLAGSSLSSYFETAEILNAQGRLLKQLKIAETENLMEISTDELADGIYLLRLKDDKNENLVLKKLAVQH